jgi:surface antigen
MKLKHWIFLVIVLLILGITIFFVFNKNVFHKSYNIGDPIDSLNHVCVYYNETSSNVSGRNLAADGYNLGLKYQCVEFVKRYYYEYLGHKMPDSYGHAKDFFDKNLKDGELNKKRNLIQYSQFGSTKPKENDILVIDGFKNHPYGHVAIISKVTKRRIEVVQQNCVHSHNTFRLKNTNGKWRICLRGVLGWLRKE